ncbi:MAG: NAD-binding protein, partial [Prevotella sp.]|nr:NAD-binding protein [Prevotella sp.]
RDTNLLIEEGIERAEAFVALTGNAEANILACLTAKRLGVPKTIAAGHIYQMMLDADVTNMRSLMMVDSDVAEFVAAKGSPVTKKPVKDLRLPAGVTIGGLVRNNVGMLVNGNSQIEAGDSVMVFCHEHNLNKVEKYFKHHMLW